MTKLNIVYETRITRSGAMVLFGEQTHLGLKTLYLSFGKGYFHKSIISRAILVTHIIYGQ